ncbi:small secreted protein [Ilyonectria robusta]
MYLSKAILFVSLAASAIASPIRERADLLQVQAYAQFQISDGVAGNALEEVAAKFPVKEFRANLAGVSANDLAILKAARETAEAAETDAGGFNDAIDQVGEDSDDGIALQTGSSLSRLSLHKETAIRRRSMRSRQSWIRMWPPIKRAQATRARASTLRAARNPNDDSLPAGGSPRPGCSGLMLVMPGAKANRAKIPGFWDAGVPSPERASGPSGINNATLSLKQATYAAGEPGPNRWGRLAIRCHMGARLRNGLIISVRLGFSRQLQPLLTSASASSGEFHTQPPPYTAANHSRSDSRTHRRGKPRLGNHRRGGVPSELIPVLALVMIIPVLMIYLCKKKA